MKRQRMIEHVRAEKWAAQMRFCVLYHQVLLSYIYRACLSGYPSNLLLGFDLSSETLKLQGIALNLASTKIDSMLRNLQNIGRSLKLSTSDKGIFASSWQDALATCNRFYFTVPTVLPHSSRRIHPSAGRQCVVSRAHIT